MNGLLLAAVTRKGQDAGLATYGPRFAAVTRAANTFSHRPSVDFCGGRRDAYAEER